MAYKATQHEAVTWIPRPVERKTVSLKMKPEFYEEVMEYCQSNEISFSQFARFALARTMANA
ncbi:hypothetical protein SynRS9907_01797 [Synechococcus sp. RS9907]|nr:hypothetical protein SynRS9907_01797 [Synechococcus sp. RS9907]